jgi:eukaryotic-like serine/threonine-protein kinase
LSYSVSMSLAQGTLLGRYEIVAPLGAGGMGEVYRARDTRLDRTVAVKVLAEHLADTPEARQRFEREARAVSALSHPHICTLHDVGSHDGTEFLVMEYLEGETLAARLQKGAMPLDAVLKIGVQVAGALDKAHRQGIVHRDLKPGNIMLTRAGAKLLDFGLAKSAVPPATVATLTAPATAATPVTQQGAIVGTFQYMSPEQVQGQEVDARSDIFSFGSVLHEMVTGRRAFPGKSQLSVASAILEKEPEPIGTLQPLTPPTLERAVKRCLAKEPDDRWQTARDLELELRWIAEGGSQVTAAPAATSNLPGARSRIPGLAALLLGSAVLGSLAAWILKPSPAPAPRPVSRTVIALPPGQRIAGLDRPALALSPDGSELAYVAIQSGTQQVFLRAMESLEARPVAGTEGAVSPFFSPDGQWLGFFADQKLKKVAVSGGAVLTLGDAADPEGASWSSQGTIAFAPSTVSALHQVPQGGGAAQPLTRLGKGEATHRWPAFLPGGAAMLFGYGTTSGNWENQQVAVVSVGTGERRNLVQHGMCPAYAPSGHLVYVQRGSLMAMPFDPRRLAVTGAAVPVVDGVLQSSTGAAQYSVSAAGTLAYVPGGVQAARLSPVWVTRNGVEQSVAAPARGYSYPRLSPDGLRLAVCVAEPETQIWLYDFARETLARLTLEGELSGLPTWTADGKRIAFTSKADGPLNLFWQLADGGGAAERLATSENNDTPMSWSPDGQLLAFGEVNPTTGFDIWVLRMSDRKAMPFLVTPFNESTPRFSPDGRWLSYASDESGREEIYVQPYPGPGGKWPISAEGGREPVWNRNGRELFYRSGDAMMVVDIATQPAFAAGKPRVLFRGAYEPTVFTVANYDVSPDGQRFLMLKRSEQAAAAPTQINIVLNWLEELKRRVPTAQQ